MISRLMSALVTYLIFFPFIGIVTGTVCALTDVCWPMFVSVLPAAIFVLCGATLFMVMLLGYSPNPLKCIAMGAGLATLFILMQSLDYGVSATGARIMFIGLIGASIVSWALVHILWPKIASYLKL